MDADVEILDRWAAGDQAAGQELVRRHFTDIHRFFAHKCPESADDLAQQTFLSCVTSRASFRGKSTFRAYLYGIARNQLYAHLRRQSGEASLDFDKTSLAEVVTSLRARLERAQEVEQLRKALSELPAEQQLVLEMHYWHGLNSTQLAEVFQVEAATIRSRLRRARDVLREKLREDPGNALSEDSKDPLSRSLRHDAQDSDDDPRP